MLTAGLTGGIGSGKSVVAQIFKTLGIPVFDADFETRRLMEEDKILIESIKSTFGDESYVEGKLNRKYISGIVFNDNRQLEILNNLTHPATINASNEWMGKQDAPYVLKESAIFYEAGTANNLDIMIGVQAPEALRIHRVMQRNNLERHDVLARMGKQISQTIKMKLCDFVITNDEQQLLIPQVFYIHNKILEKIEAHYTEQT